MLKKIYNEAEELRNEATHRSAIRMQSLLEDNKVALLKALDEQQYEYILNGFVELVNGSATKRESYRELFQRNIDVLLYNLNRYI